MPLKNSRLSDTYNDDKVAKLLPLSYGLSLLKQLLPIPTHIFKADYHYFEKFDSEQEDDWNVLKTDFAFRRLLIDKIKEKQVTIISGERPVLYGGVQCTDSLYLVAGPVVIAPVDQNFSRLYALKHNASNVSLTFCDVKSFASFLLLVYSSVSGRYMYLSDFLDDNLLSDELLNQILKQFAAFYESNANTFKTHNPGSFEDDIRHAIKSGDSEALKKAHNSIYASMRGTISKNELRNAQNLAIVDITIASRAAIDAGLSSEELYQISDAFILEVENCRYKADAEALARACAYRCCRMVDAYLRRDRADNVQSSAVVQMACDYIEKHIYEKFDLGSICSKFKVSAGYLSKLFKKERSMTLSEYARKRKIEIAKILLQSTDKSILEISRMLAFHSQSHFGRIFLKETSQTPALYRRLKHKNSPF